MLVLVWLKFEEQTSTWRKTGHCFILVACPFWYATFKIVSILALILSEGTVFYFHIFP